MLAAMMTAANLGPRVTGWGFVVFTIGSVGWTVVALGSGQANLLWTNGLLALVNLVGIWRWLGREARYAKGGEAAAEAARAATGTPDLSPLTQIAGAPLLVAGGETFGRVVDGMVRGDDLRLSYLVVSDGGTAGVGETLYAVDARQARIMADGVLLAVSAADLSAREPLSATDWPATPTAAQLGQPVGAAA
jgi:hypothetical protein